MKIEIRKFVSIVCFMALSFGLFSCYGANPGPDKEKKISVLTKKVDEAEMKLAELLTNPNGIDAKAVQATLKSIREANQAVANLKESGASWFDIGKGALGGMFGRTLLHAARTALIVAFPATAGGGIATLFGLLLGNSGTGREEEDKRRPGI